MLLIIENLADFFQLMVALLGIAINRCSYNCSQAEEEEKIAPLGTDLETKVKTLQFSRFDHPLPPLCSLCACLLISVLQCVPWAGWKCLRKTWLLARAASLSTTASGSFLITNTTCTTRLVSGER